MCGIVGAISERNIATILIECLKRLEYRGYDSAGIATIDDKGKLICERSVGKISALAASLKKNPLRGHIGISHTRWATHGAPTTYNAHPHIAGNSIAIVHNGIIENYEELREKLKSKGVKFSSDTDTEVIVHLLDDYIQKGHDFLQATHKTIKELRGAYALAIINAKEADKIIAVRSGSPLVVGIGINENFLASDASALLPVTNNFIYLEEGDFAEIERNHVKIYNSKLKIVKRQTKVSEMSADSAEKGNFRHFMQKEIFEQPRALADTLQERLLADEVPAEIFGNNAKKIFAGVKRLLITACGSSYHAALAGKYWIEKLAAIPCQVEIASEFRYRETVTEPQTLFITISQSGETADTLAALRKAKKLPFLTSLTICNAPESSLVRESELAFITRAGIEVGVATTKAFTAQLTGLLMLAIALGKYHNNKLDLKTRKNLINQLKHLPVLAEEILKLENQIAGIAKLLEHSTTAFYLGRGISYSIALEGALKIKEISYIHAEAYPAGELKHGALALIDQDTPIVVVGPDDNLYEKLHSNLQEVRARGGNIIIFTDKELTSKPNLHVCQMPKIAAEITPVIYTIPLQLLAYHVALIKGTDIDQPRNLAKSVTVE
jgi:glutamine---fructose-6-phosphate transaminase (isomerizing)